MTIGPDPMTRMCWMSVRFGITSRPPAVPRCASSFAFQECGEAVEQVRAIVRAGCGFGVVLHAERAHVARAQPLDHVVVQADVAYLDRTELSVGRCMERSVHCEAMVVGGDLHLAGAKVLHRLVDPAVA